MNKSMFTKSFTISIHALREEGDTLPNWTGRNFARFLSTPSARRATFGASHPFLIKGISIHALREEGDPTLLGCNFAIIQFLSTPSARRATYNLHNKHYSVTFLSTPSARRATLLVDVLRYIRINFYPRPPRGGRRRAHCLRPVLLEISIHALREEGDL